MALYYALMLSSSIYHVFTVYSANYWCYSAFHNSIALIHYKIRY